ncbi:MAG: hypothetical protein VXW43_19785, partial [Pseudomonadota bacterium]|nr:hypothetical protein [Pseudomonadota bacterium]
KGLAHIHSQWVPQAELTVDPQNKRAVQRFLKILAAEAAGGGAADATWELDGDEEGRAAGGRGKIS